MNTLNSVARQARFGILVISLNLNLVCPGKADEQLPALQKRDLSKAIQCPESLKGPIECKKYKQNYSLVTCPDGDRIFGGMGATDESFQVWCGPSTEGRYAKSITCPNGSVARAGVSYMSNIWTLRCERDKEPAHAHVEFHGPFFEWYSSDGKLQSILSGNFDSSQPVGYWIKEDALGNLIGAGKMAYSYDSIYNMEKDDEWLEWDSGKWRRLYYIQGDGPWHQRQEYLQELRKRALKSK